MERNNHFTRSTAVLFAIVCGLAVTNVYYAQPLLNTMGKDLGIHPGSVGIIVTITQTGYALGLLLLLPVRSGIGSIAATTTYAWAGWTGVCILGAAISAMGLIFWAITLPRKVVCAGKYNTFTEP